MTRIAYYIFIGKLYSEKLANNDGRNVTFYFRGHLKTSKSVSGKKLHCKINKPLLDLKMTPKEVRFNVQF